MVVAVGHIFSFQFIVDYYSRERAIKKNLY